MRKKLLAVLAAFTLSAGMLGVAAPAVAGTATDSLGRCLVNSTSPNDRTLLIRWIFAAMSQHPEVATLSMVDAEDAAQLNKDTGELFTTLIADRCRNETRAALEQEGEQAIQAAFSILGQVAMQGIMSAPSVASYMNGLDQHVDAERLQQAFGE
ncbi:MAG: hypothetical protein R3217_00435 [Gammaproteobacteria bacterium]|nr:hypothetical protein [Gammaproteobacteria bacterium]